MCVSHVRVRFTRAQTVVYTITLLRESPHSSSVEGRNERNPKGVFAGGVCFEKASQRFDGDYTEKSLVTSLYDVPDPAEL